MEHLPGEQNVWADMLSIQNKSQYKVTAESIKQLHSLLLALINQSTKGKVGWPYKADIRKEQSRDKPCNKRTLTNKYGMMQTENGQNLVIDSEKRLQFHIVIAMYIGRVGHRRVKSTLKTIDSMIYWTTMIQDRSNLVKIYFHCIATESGDMTPRHLG